MKRARPADMQAARLTQALTGLVLEVFRLNGDLLVAGDALVGDLGLTSARWQVLGAAALSPVPLPVAHVARDMGLTRQAVQRVVNDMCAEGLVRLDPNPHHRRAGLAAMTDRGAEAYAAAGRQARWAETVMAGLAPEDVENAARVLGTLQPRFRAQAGPSPAAPRLPA